MDAQQQTRNFPSPSGSEPSGSDRSITDHANEALRQVSETAQQAQAQAREAVANLSTEATGSVNDLFNHQVNAGAEFVSSLAHSIGCAADDLSRNAPQFAELARGAAHKMRPTSLRTKNLTLSAGRDPRPPCRPLRMPPRLLRMMTSSVRRPLPAVFSPPNVVLPSQDGRAEARGRRPLPVSDSESHRVIHSRLWT
jgi:hypothetical protein